VTLGFFTTDSHSSSIRHPPLGFLTCKLITILVEVINLTPNPQPLGPRDAFHQVPTEHRRLYQKATSLLTWLAGDQGTRFTHRR
jgi:hypothetical protein